MPPVPVPALVWVLEAVSAVGVVVSAVQSLVQVVVPAVGVASLVPEVELAVVALVPFVLVVQAALPFVFQVVRLAVSMHAFVVVVQSFAAVGFEPVPVWAFVSAVWVLDAVLAVLVPASAVRSFVALVRVWDAAS